MWNLNLIKGIFLLFILSGCAQINHDYRYVNYSSEDFIRKNYEAADSLSIQLKERKAENEPTVSPVIVVSIVNMNQLNKTSAFGRLVAEQTSARFSQLKYNVVELKMRNDVLVKNNQGEFLLTREIKDIADSVNAQAVVVGTYAENLNDIYINLKVVRPSNNVVLAAYSYAIPKAANIKGLLYD